MAKRGRKKKPGKREPNGRLQRPSVTFDKGSQRAQDKMSVYGPDGSDAIGRAYQAGLLGEDGLELRNLARKIFRAYWPMLAVGREKSCLGLDIHGQAANDDLLDHESREYKIRRERRLTDTLRMIDRMGAAHRRAFDQLCIDINPDCGPPWLEGLLWAKSHGRDASLADEEALERALGVLREVSKQWA